MGHIAALCPSWRRSLDALYDGDESILEEVHEHDDELIVLFLLEEYESGRRSQQTKRKNVEEGSSRLISERCQQSNPQIPRT